MNGKPPDGDFAELADADLARLYQGGNKHAGSVLFERWKGDLKRAVENRIGNADSAESVALSAIVQVLQGLREGKLELADGRSIWPLFFRNALWKIGTRLRRRRPSPLGDDIDVVSPAARRPESEMIVAELMDAIRAWAVTPRQKTIVDLLMQGYTSTDIAAEVSCSTRYVRMVRDELLVFLETQGRQQVDAETPPRS